MTGKPKTRRNFFSVIQSHFNHIHKTIAKIEVKEVIPLQGYSDINIDYKHLLKLEERGIETYYYPGIDSDINVLQLLEGIEPKEKREAKRELDEEKPATTRKASLSIINRNNPWLSGSFYLVGFSVTMIVLIVAGMTLPFIALPFVFITALLSMSIIGAFQLKNDEGLNQKSFLTLMFEVFKRLPFLKKK